MLQKTSNTLIVRTSFVDLFSEASPLFLECGKKLDTVQVAYQTYGTLNSDKSNTILICHALTGNAHAAGILPEIETDEKSNPDLVKRYSERNINKVGWWDTLIGPGKTFDTDKYFIISSNILGSCYGTTGPVTKQPNSQKRFGAELPVITVRDMVKAQKKLLEHLGINKLLTIAGGSLGGMQALEWAIMYPEIVQSIIPIAASARHSAWAMGLNQIAKDAITSDPDWNNGNYETQPVKGLALARKIGMITYRTNPSFAKKFGRDRVNHSDYFDTDNIFQINSYLNYQGDKLVERFDANAYLCLANAMDLHDVTHNRGTLEDALGSIKCKSLCIGINSDVLYPPEEQKEIASNIPHAEYKEINSIHGHDGFLIEFDQMDKFITEFLKTI